MSINMIMKSDFSRVLDVSFETSAAIEHSVHGLVENMFGRMHARVYAFFHGNFLLS